ncbi:MAG: thymidylate kinase, partial [Dehalococcoidales bacterium]
MSLFITFEGEEGSGKSYQAEELRKQISAQGIPVIVTHEPGGTKLGEKISDLVKWAQETDISPMTELLLFNASRAQHIKEVIRPALNEGKVV